MAASKVKLTDEQFETLRGIYENQRKSVDTSTLIGRTDGVKALEDGGGFFGSVLAAANTAKNTIKHVNTELQGLAKVFEEMIPEFGKTQDASSKFAKAIGMNGAAMNAQAKRIQNLVDVKDFGSKFGVTGEDIFKLQQSYVSNIDRNVGINDQGFETMASMKSLGMTEEEIGKFASENEKLGVSLERSGKATARMWNDAKKSGISFSKLSKTVSDNLNSVAKITFKEGIKGLEKMVKRSIELGLSFESTQHVAEGLMDSGVEGAIKMGAELQVLGGNFARMANPLSMLNEGVSDAGALQERIAKMVTDRGRYNSETHEFEISREDKLLIRQAAKALGLSADELTKSAQRQGLGGYIEKELENQGGANMSPELKNMLKNTGVINENGKVGANIDGKFYDAKQIANSDKLMSQLEMQGQSDGENIADIAVDVRSIADKFSNFGKAITNKQGNLEGEYLGDAVNTEATWINNQKWLKDLFGEGNFWGNTLDKGFGEENSVASHAANVLVANDEREGFRSWGFSPEGLFDFRSWFTDLMPDFLYNHASTAPTVKAANGGEVIGPSHAEGGVPVHGSNIVMEGGEYVVNKHAMRNPMLSSVVRSINESTNDGPSVHMANGGDVLFADGGAVSKDFLSRDNFMKNGVSLRYGLYGMNYLMPNYKAMYQSEPVEENKKGVVREVLDSVKNLIKGKESSQNNDSQKIDLNISGTIKLETPDGKTIDTSALLKNPIFIREMTKLITDSMESKKGIYNRTSL